MKTKFFIIILKDTTCQTKQQLIYSVAKIKTLLHRPLSVLNDSVYKLQIVSVTCRNVYAYRNTFSQNKSVFVMV